MAEAKKKRTLIWAVNPFVGEMNALRSAAWAVRAIVREGGFEVQPVFVCSEGGDETLQPGSELYEDLVKRGQNELDNALARTKIQGVRSLEILCKRFFTARQGVRELIDFAKERKAELIVTSTHGRKGLKRFFLGSFAESLTLLSDIPLLIVHPNWRRVPEIKRILFPTDFSDQSKEAFLRIIAFAQERKSQVILFHKAACPIYPGFESAFTSAPYPSYANNIERDIKEANMTADDWANIANQSGVRVEIVIDGSRGGSIADAVVRRANRLNAMVALASQSDLGATLLMGSTARQIIRQSEQPVWVIHPSEAKPANTLASKRLSAGKSA